MLVTRLTSQLEIGWLKSIACEKIASILVTEEVSYAPMGWLNWCAKANIRLMSWGESLLQWFVKFGNLSKQRELNEINADVSQAPKGLLNSFALLKMRLLLSQMTYPSFSNLGKCDAAKNVYSKIFTDEISQAPRGIELCRLKKCLQGQSLTTCPTGQVLIKLLLQKSFSILVTLQTSHCPSGLLNLLLK